MSPTGQLYGPPPDPRQVPAAWGPLDAPWAWLLSLLLGLLALLAARACRRPALRAGLGYLGLALLLTAPLGGAVGRWVYGAWPTLDKAGSYLFYLDGVHRRALLHPLRSLSDPAVRLIGVQLGHLWMVQLLDLFTDAHGAFDLLALLSPALGAWAAWALFREAGAAPWAAALAAFPYGFGLHLFRDLNWTTIEKAAVWGAPLYLWALLRARRLGGAWLAAPAATLLLASWVNAYFAVLDGLLGLLFLLAARDRRSALAVLGSYLALAPLALAQLALLERGGALSDPARYLQERAAQDTLCLWPPAWDRLEAWRALNLPLLGLGLAWGWRHRRERGIRWALLGAGLLAALALGPHLPGTPSGPPNPLYACCRLLVPGFWRLAHPEYLLYGAELLLLGLAARALGELSPPPRLRALLWGTLLLGWVLGVRLHPAFPGFSEPVPVHLDPGWAERVFGEGGGEP